MSDADVDAWQPEDAGVSESKGWCADEKAALERRAAEALQRLHAHQHPSKEACNSARFLICHSKFQAADYWGLGARFFHYGRCLTAAYTTGRVAVLKPDQPGVQNVHVKLLQPWSTCTLQDAKAAKDTWEFFPRGVLEKKLYGGRDRIPKEYADLGRVWWKGIEQRYLLRPKRNLHDAVLARKEKLGWTADLRVAGIHVRRGDKTKGCKHARDICAGTALQRSAIIEAATIEAADFAKALLWLVERGPAGTKPEAVYVASDEQAVQDEIEAALPEGIRLLRHEAPHKRFYSTDKGDGGYSDKSTVLDAMVEMSLLTDLDYLVFTFSNSFGAVPWVQTMSRTGCMAGWATLENGGQFIPHALPSEVLPLCAPNATVLGGAASAGARRLLKAQQLPAGPVTPERPGPKACALQTRVEKPTPKYFGVCQC